MMVLKSEPKCTCPSVNDTYGFNKLFSKYMMNDECMDYSLLHLDFNGELLIGRHGLVVGQSHEADLVQGVRGVGNKLSEEDLQENHQMRTQGH